MIVAVKGQFAKLKQRREIYKHSEGNKERKKERMFLSVVF